MKTTLNLLVAIITLLLLFCTAAFAEGTWLYYSGEEIKGTVVDADTKEPIEGAIVIAQWALTQIPGEGFGGYAKIHVSVTDKEGRFAVPSWASFRPWKVLSVIHGLAPKIIIYKPGYDLYWSHKLARAGYPDRMDLTKEEKAKIKEGNSLTPAKLKKVHTDDEIIKYYRKFDSQIDHYGHYSKKQLTDILNATKTSVIKLPEANKKSKGQIIDDNRQLEKFWLR